MAEVFGNIGVCEALFGDMVMLVAYGGVGALMDKGSGLVCDAHGGV